MNKNINRNQSYAIILCGGAGTRLWPVSRSSQPKQLIKFKGKYSLLQASLVRLTKKILPQNIFLVSNVDHQFIIQDQLSKIFKNDKPNLILEPIAKNTLPAIAIATKKIMKIDSNAIISVFPSDHEIKNETIFLDLWESSIEVAKKNYFTLIGIKPSFPATGFGYIKPENKINLIKDKEIYEVAEFKEKPNKTSAETFIKKRYLWNAGMFIFKGSLFNELMKKFQPKLLAIIEDSNESNLDILYKKIDSISIDYGLAEKADKVAVLSDSIEWSDLGNWNSIFNLLSKDKNNNSIKGNVVSQNSNNSLLWNESGIMATYGLKDIIAINTNDATLVCHRKDSEKVKDLVNEIKVNNFSTTETHLEVFRPWGSYTILEQGKGFKIKRIEVNPKQKLSLQLHQKRSEHWVVIEGTAKVTNGTNVVQIKKNESTFIPLGTKHRLENPKNTPLIIIEVQVGVYVGEDDIIRFEDKYDRLK
ncbi:mannose-1-phosphate guanylyltransferase/mannose-6-phosphate isomerase [Methylophilaceae bacterium]|jgi:mannose-1-phosphate guanylyltransferase / mannose-6-phosphate isomerase|nr:mannose-1-phosphate guanylyltransferase/mannose-6-phosphate isomerase [Methylophilaceae bacterium]